MLPAKFMVLRLAEVAERFPHVDCVGVGKPDR